MKIKTLKISLVGALLAAIVLLLGVIFVREQLMSFFDFIK